jgi:hypothetical protein
LADEMPRVDAPRRITALNRNLVWELIPSIERHLEKIPYDSKPRTGFIVGYGFYDDGLRILKLIEFLERNIDQIKKSGKNGGKSYVQREERNKNLEILKRSLSAVDEVLYLQFRLLARKLDYMNFSFDNNEFNYPLVGSDENGSHNGEHNQQRVISVFSKIFDKKNENGYLKRIARRIILALFRARKAIDLTYEEQKDFLAQILDSLRTEIIVGCEDEVHKGCATRSAGFERSKAELLSCVDLLRVVAVSKKSSIPIKTIAKWTIGTLILIGVIWGIWRLARASVNVKTDPSLNKLADQFTSGEKGAITEFFEKANKREDDGEPLITVHPALTKFANMFTDGKEGAFTRLCKRGDQSYEDHGVVLSIGTDAETKKILVETKETIKETKDVLEKVSDSFEKVASLAEHIQKNQEESKPAIETRHEVSVPWKRMLLSAGFLIWLLKLFVFV